jgi:hypothetical protein
MAVASRGAALSALRELINDDPVEARTILRRPYLPDGLQPSDDPVGMDPSTLIGGYGNEARYTLSAEDPATMLAIAGPAGRGVVRASLDHQRHRCRVCEIQSRSHYGGRHYIGRGLSTRRL